MRPRTTRADACAVGALNAFGCKRFHPRSIQACIARADPTIPSRHPGAWSHTMKRLSATLLALGLSPLRRRRSTALRRTNVRTGYTEPAAERDLRLGARGARGSGDRFALLEWLRQQRLRQQRVRRTTTTAIAATPRAVPYPTNGGYASNGSYPSNDPYYPQQGRYGTDTGRTVATVVGGLAGAVLGSKVGGGSGHVGCDGDRFDGRWHGRPADLRRHAAPQVRAQQRTVCDDQYGNNTSNYGGGYNGNDNYGSYNANNEGASSATT